MMTLNEFEAKAILFLDKLSSELKNSNLNTDIFELDHICWRVDSIYNYEKVESMLLQFGTLFHKSEFNGRQISLIQLDEPIVYQERNIHLIELPAPKPEKPYPNGFEHAEFVVTTPLLAFAQKSPKLNWNKKNIDKNINPDIKLNFGEISVKFHPYSLAYVVKNLE